METDAVLRLLQIFNFFVMCLDVIITIAKKEGKFNEGFVDLSGNSMYVEGQPKTVFTALCDGCRYVVLPNNYTRL